MAALFGEQRKLLKRYGNRPGPARLRDLERRGFALRVQDPRQAVRLLDSVLEHDPDRVSSLRACGRVLLQLREFETAVPYWERLDRLAPGEIEPPLQLARIHLRAGRPLACAQHARRVLAINPLHEEAGTLLARAMELGATSGSDAEPAPALAPPPPASQRASQPRSGWFTRLGERLLRIFRQRSEPASIVAAQRTRVSKPLPAEPPPQRLDPALMLAQAEESARRGDAVHLVDTLELVAGIAGPETAVVEALKRHRPLIEAAVAGINGSLAPDERSALASRARRLWIFLPKPETAPPERTAIARPAEPPHRDLDAPSLIVGAEKYSRDGDVLRLVETLDMLAGLAGPEREVLQALAHHRPEIEQALADASGGMDGATRAMLTVRARRLWAFLPQSATPSTPPTPPQPAPRLDPPFLIALADDQAKAGEIARLVETLDVLAGVAGPLPAVLETFAKHRPTIDGALAKTDGTLDHPARALLAAHARRLWAFLPQTPPQIEAPSPAAAPSPARMDPPFLIALADDQAKAGEIARLVETLDVLAGVAGPQADVLETFSRHRPMIDTALAKADGVLDHPTRTLLAARVRRLWVFLPDQPAEAEPETPPPPRLDAPYLIDAADKHAFRADIPGLVETLDILASVAGPKPEVIEALTRHRQAIDEALSSPDGVLDHTARAVLAARARRLWVFLPEATEQSAPVTAAPEPILEPQEPDERTLAAAAEEHARLGNIPELIETLDRLAGIAGPQPEVLDALARHRAIIDASLARPDGLFDARVRTALAARVRRLWAFLPDDETTTPPPAVEPAQLESDLRDAPSLLEAASVYARWGDIASLVKTLDALAGVAGPQPEVVEALARYRPSIDAALAKADEFVDPQTRAVVRARSRRLWAFLPPVQPEPPPPVEEPVIPNARLDTPYLLALAAEYSRQSDIPRLVKTLDVLAGVAGPQPEVIDALGQYRSPIDTALGDPASQLAPQTRAMLKTRARRLWTFLPDMQVEPERITAAVQAEPPASPLDAPALTEAADEHARRGDVPSLVETLDVLAGIAGPQPDVVATLARLRPIIDAALFRSDGPLDAQSRAMLGVRVRRLWAFLPDAPAEPASPAPVGEPTQPPRPPDPSALIAAADGCAQEGDIPGLIEALDTLAGMAGPLPEVIQALVRHRSAIDAALARTDGPLDAQSRATLSARTRRLWAFLPDTQPALQPAEPVPTVPQPLAERVESRIRRIDPSTWLEAARLAARSEDKETVVACAREAVKAAPGNRTVFKDVTAFLAECGMHEEVIALWRAAYDEAPTNLSLALGLLRAVEASTQPARMFEELEALIAEMQPFQDFSSANVTSFVEMFRRLASFAEKPAYEAQVNALESTLRAYQGQSALLYWALGTLNVWRFDRAAALAEFDRALTQPPLPSGTILDLNAERALLFVRYHLHGEALAAMAKVSDRLLRSNAYYQRRLSSVQAVAELCPDAPSPLRYPECLIDVIVDEISREPITYEPRSRHLVMISGSLGQGGGERQTITVVKRMITDPRIAKLILLVRSTHLRPTDDFFLPLVSQLPLDCHIYGKNWYTASVVEKKLPELANRPRLARAIDLLPQTIREDVIRISRHLLDERPEAVHIWQDITGAALACLICGVPNFFAHRGSLSPDYWGQTERQTETHFRPMKHTYRRLLERPDFVVLNNSDAGCKSDQKWTNWPDSAPFQFLANAIDFSVLGPNLGQNMELRSSLGIPPDALVVGGSFRIFSVKRPEYWIAAAGIVGAAVPNAHFLIIGDGDMTELVQERAKEYGISDRLHLPGRVSNVGDWYRTMDLSLLTSEREGIPNALIEAQHFGVPIVATHVGGIPEAIEMGTTGYTVPGVAPDDYAERIIAIFRDPDWRARAYIRAPEFVHDKFSLEHVVDKLIGYYGFSPAAPADLETEPA